MTVSEQPALNRWQLDSALKLSSDWVQIRTATQLWQKQNMVGDFLTYSVSCILLYDFSCMSHRNKYKDIFILLLICKALSITVSTAFKYKNGPLLKDMWSYRIFSFWNYLVVLITHLNYNFFLNFIVNQKTFTLPVIQVGIYVSASLFAATQKRNVNSLPNMIEELEILMILAKTQKVKLWVSFRVFHWNVSE